MYRSFLNQLTLPADKNHYKRFLDNIVLDEHTEKYTQESVRWEETGGCDTGWMEL
jgi:hypothetical protein